jgi:ABC-2 type transport system ATP-binding protein
MNSPGDAYTVIAEELTKVFGKFVAVDRVSFQVSRGEIFGFLGPNGAGKTTTIKILCGLLTPSSGRASVAGWDCSTQYEEIRKNIGYMSQKFSIYEDLTVEENLDFFGGVYGLSGAGKRAREDWVLEMAGLSRQKKMMTGELPLGWKQRLALGCAVLHSPPILFLDEPTSGVDPISRRSFWELIHKMSDDGVTVFVTTHYMDEAGYCNRLALMASGGIIAMGAPGELKSRWMTDSVIELECADLLRAVEVLSLEDTLSEVAVFGNLLHLVAADPDEAIKKARERLKAAGISPGRAEVIPPSLEDVFVTLTSRGADAAKPPS